MSPLLKAVRASLLAVVYKCSSSLSTLTRRIPLPPPPADAFSIIGYPISFAMAFASAAFARTPSLPGITGTPAALMVFFAWALSPIALIISELGPMNANPLSSQIFENSEFSARKPYPG